LILKHPEKMKYFPITASAAILGALLISACENPSVETGTLDTNGEATQSAGAKPSGSDHEPIRNTSPEGSSMDPSSNAYIVFDGSGSMNGEPIEQAKRAVAAFVDGAPEDLNIGLLVFDKTRMRGKEVVPLGRGEEQRRQIAQEISGIEAGGGTPLGSSIKVGTGALISQFQKQLRYGDIRLIVVTDGAASDRRDFDESIRFAQKYHVPIYTIGFRIRTNHPLRQYSESYFTANDEQELLGAMQETLAELDDSTSLDL